MLASDNFFNIIKEFEGFVSCPYKDQIGIPTIGIGTTVYPNGKKVSMSDKCITFEQAKEYTKNHIKSIEVLLNKHLPEINQNQFDSLVSFIYNIGSGAFLRSTLLRKAKIDANDPSIRYEFRRWKRAGGRVLAGLVKRRNKEADLYFKAV